MCKGLSCPRSNCARMLSTLEAGFDTLPGHGECPGRATLDALAEPDRNAIRTLPVRPSISKQGEYQT